MGRGLPLRFLFCVAIGLFAVSQVSAQRTYTLDGDFDEGTLVNVNHDAPNSDQLQLNESTEPFPFINIATARFKGTIVRVNTETGVIIGEYRTAPENLTAAVSVNLGNSPSRTTVDLFGNVWATNRYEQSSISNVVHGSVVKIGLIIGGTRVNSDGTPNPAGDYLAPPFGYSTCVDRDSDGLIKTSRGSGDVRSWTNVSDDIGGTDGTGDTNGDGFGAGIVQDADDECILVFQRLPDAPQARHVSVTSSNDVWVGGYPFSVRSFWELDGSTGEPLANVVAALGGPTPGYFDARRFNCGGYGGLTDGNGIVWSASISHNAILRYDPSSDTGMCIGNSQSYGTGIDNNGFIWNTTFGGNSITKISPAGAVQPGYPKTTLGGGSDRGVAVTPVDNNVWVANSGGTDVSRLDNDGNVRKVIPVGNGPTGVAVDANGKVWATNLYSDSASRIDPNGGGDGLGVVDLTVPLGAGATPYNYSDMTGIVSIGSTAPQGTWTVVYDGGAAGTQWGTVSWNGEPQGSVPTGTSITVQVRASDSQAGLAGETFMPVTNGVAFAKTGQFIEVQTTLLRSDPAAPSPVLSDLTVAPLTEEPQCRPGQEASWDGSVVFIDGMAFLPVTAEFGVSSLTFYNASNLVAVGVFDAGMNDLVAAGDFTASGPFNDASLGDVLEQFTYSGGVDEEPTSVMVKVAPEVGGQTSSFFLKIEDAGPCPPVDIDPVIALGIVSNENGETPGFFTLQQNYPNPFNPSTTIRFALPYSTHATLIVYDLMGQEVSRLADGQLSAGVHEATWNGTNAAGEAVASGTYLYRVDAGEFSKTMRMTLVK